VPWDHEETTTFIALADELPSDTLDLSNALEVAGFGDAFWFGERLYMTNGETFEVTR
jgi:hypothetical protein